MDRQTTLAASLIALALLPGGCISRGIKEGLGIATGGKGMAIVLQPVRARARARPLGAYQRFELGKISDAMGKTPREFFRLLPVELDKQLAARRIPNLESGKTLVIEGEILHYESSGMFGHVFGPLEEAVARIRLVDKDSGRTLGEANCVGRTKESVNLGVRTKAEGMAKAVVGWIDKLYPQDKRTRED